MRESSFQGIAITREVSASIADCELTHLSRKPIDVVRARRQHGEYVKALGAAGWQVVQLPEQPELPDAVFVEDTAIILDGLAVISHPGAVSRRPELDSIEESLAAIGPTVRLSPEVTLDGGDVLVVGKRIFVGISERTNPRGADALDALSRNLGYTLETVPVTTCLHLKSAVTSLGNDTLLVTPLWVDTDLFEGFQLFDVVESEPWAANCVDLRGSLLHGAEFPKTANALRNAGFRVTSIAMDELAKAEGAATCCSVLIP